MEKDPARSSDADQAGTSFLLQEHEQLSAEIAAQLKEAWDLEKFALGGAAALAAWLATHQVNVRQVWWLPFLFLLLCAIRFGAAMFHIVFRLAEYVKKIELEYLPDTGGFQTWFRDKRPAQTIAHAILWLTALVIALAAVYLAPKVDTAQSRGAVEQSSIVNQHPTQPLERTAGAAAQRR
jgi:hypothetical protein